MTDFINDTDLRRLAERRADAKIAFWGHVATYVAVNAGLAIYNLTTTPANPWFLWSLGCWGLALAAQALDVYSNASAIRGKAIEAELRRLRAARTSA
jgi:hypothetical protein